MRLMITVPSLEHQGDAGMSDRELKLADQQIRRAATILHESFFDGPGGNRVHRITKALHKAHKNICRELTEVYAYERDDLPKWTAEIGDADLSHHFPTS